MNYTPEHYADRPNLLRLARTIAACKYPGQVADTLTAVLMAHRAAERPAPLPEPENPSNNEKFHALLNSCQDPKAVYDTLAAIAERRQVER